MNTTTNQGHPDLAFQFRAAAPASLEASDGKAQGKPRKFSGIPYSGNAIAHRYWGQVVFDLSSTRANEKTPILVNHDPDKRCGFAALTISADSITITDGTLMANEEGQEVAMESDAGFPWQMSVFIQPGSIEELKAGTSATINGRPVQGPATVFRNNLIREVSFTPTGVDNDTEAAAFSARGASVSPATTKETTMTETEKLQAEVTALKASLAASEAAKTAAETALADHKKAVRASAVKELFSAIGREHTDESAAPYMEMSDLAFSAVSADLKASVKDADKSHLFSDHATGDKAADQNQAGTKFSINPADVYANRRTK